MMRYGMLGGSGGFIGNVHRRAAALAAGESGAALCCGVFSGDREKSLKFGESVGVPADRIYPDAEAMAAGEAARADRPDFAIVATPNARHFPAVKALLEAGFHVMCDKPLATTSADCAALGALARRERRALAVTYTYFGYPMLHHMRRLIDGGKLGDIMSVSVDYLQDGRLRRLRDGMDPADMWKFDPAVVGPASALMDIGVHVEYAVRLATGLRHRRVLARFDYSPGKLPLETGADILTDCGGARGSYRVSQVANGEENRFWLKVHGTDGALEWDAAAPERLVFTSTGRPRETYLAGEPYLDADIRAMSVMPKGHPEGMDDVFARIYRAFFAAMSGEEGNCPGAEDAAESLRFVEACIASERGGNTWIEVLRG